MEKKKQFLPTYRGCFICGQKDENSSTLNLRFQVTENGVKVIYTPTKAQEGYKGIIHGGILCSILDETIGWAVAVDRKRYFITAELNTRFIRSLPVGKKVSVLGKIVEHKSRYSIGEGQITDEKGTVYAKAKGKYFLMPDSRAKSVEEYMTFEEDDLDISKSKR